MAQIRDTIDDLALELWAIHPKQIDLWEQTAPKKPDDYPGGMRAWYYACRIREMHSAEIERLRAQLAMAGTVAPPVTP